MKKPRNILKKNGLDLHIEEWVYNDIVQKGKLYHKILKKAK